VRCQGVAIPIGVIYSVGIAEHNVVGSRTALYRLVHVVTEREVVGEVLHIGGVAVLDVIHYPKNTLDNVRGVFSFVVFGVVLAPLATSFLDAAAVVITGWGRTLWPLGVQRFWTNALAELTLVPAIVLWVSNGISWLKRASVAQYVEAALLAVGTVLVMVLVFGFQLFSPVYNSRTSVPSSTVFVMGCSPLWFGWIELLSLIRRADLHRVHHARARAVPVRIHGTKRPVFTDSIMCGCCATDVPLGRTRRDAPKTPCVGSVVASSRHRSKNVTDCT
jgi:hypothetical protein